MSHSLKPEKPGVDLPGQVHRLKRVEYIYPDVFACPFPYADDRPAADEILRGEPVQKMVPLKDLFATQYAVSATRIRRILKHIAEGRYKDRYSHAPYVTVIEHDKRLLIENGHHHCVALILAKETEIYANVISTTPK